MPKKISLFNPKTKKTFEVELYPVSAWVKTKVREVEYKYNDIFQKEYEKRAQNFDELRKIIKVSDIYALSSADTAKMQETVAKIEKSLSHIEDEKDLAICRVIINKEQLDDETKSLIESEPSGEFWQVQDLEEVKSAVESFL